MTTIPAARLLWIAGILLVASLGVLVFPGAWPLIVALDLALFAFALLDLLITPARSALEVRRIAPPTMSHLTDYAATLVVRNHARVSLTVRLRDTVPAQLATTTEEMSGPVPAGGEQRWEYAIRPTRRGIISWGAIQLRYRSVLGLWERQKTVAAAQEARVYPNLTSLYRYALLARTNRLDNFGIRPVRVRGGAWEFESLRDYASGDDVRLMDWKATARRRKLIVRNQEAERNQTVLLLIDCGRLMQAEVNGTAKLDHAVNAALILAHIALARGDRVGLCTFADRVHAWVAPRPHPSHLHLITETLFDLRGAFTESDHARCLRLLGARHRKRALLVVLTDFVDAETAGDMIAHLQQTSRRHLVLFVALKDPDLDSAARIRPANALEGFRKAAATDLLHERREVLERLRKMGAHVLDVDPAGITAPLLNQYLEITFRGLL
jgi:uncharacterized protein (DUF58 family)